MTAMQGEIHGRWTKNAFKILKLTIQYSCNVMQLLCAVLAECFYTGASITFKAIKCLQHHLGPFHPLIFLLQESRWLPTQQGGAWPLDGSSLCNFNHCNFSHLTSFPSLRREQQHRTLLELKCLPGTPPWPGCGSMSRRYAQWTKPSQRNHLYKRHQNSKKSHFLPWVPSLIFKF